MATINCKEIAANIREDLKGQIAEATEKYGEKPFLEVVQVGADPSSASYVKSIFKTCDNMGAAYNYSEYDADIQKMNY